jgi:hypothetical protein
MAVYPGMYPNQAVFNAKYAVIEILAKTGCPGIRNKYRRSDGTPGNIFYELVIRNYYANDVSL